MSKLFKVILATFVLFLFMILYPFGLIIDAFRDNYVRDVSEIWHDYIAALKADES